jgi:hypothetical protein
MIAINGPMMGKFYNTSEITNTVIDHVTTYGAVFELTYYRTRNGWAFHSWKNLFSLRGI